MARNVIHIRFSVGNLSLSLKDFPNKLNVTDLLASLELKSSIPAQLIELLDQSKLNMDIFIAITLLFKIANKLDRAKSSFQRMSRMTFDINYIKANLACGKILRFERIRMHLGFRDQKRPVKMSCVFRATRVSMVKCKMFTLRPLKVESQSV